MKRILTAAGICMMGLCSGVFAQQQSAKPADTAKAAPAQAAQPAQPAPSLPNPVKDSEGNAPAATDQWSFIQIGLFPRVPGCTQYSNVYGLKLGLPMVDGNGRVYGVEPSFLYSGTSYVIGFQGSWFGPAIAREVVGVQGGPGSAVARKVCGVQGGAVSVCTERFDGFQGSFVGVVTGPVKGCQAAIVNYAESLNGLQIGAFNYSEKNGAQFGLINIIKNGALPFCPIFNIAY
jgi:hypothetical protein